MFDLINIECGLIERERMAQGYARRRAVLDQVRAESGTATPILRRIVAGTGARLIQLGQRLATTATVAPTAHQS
jgi:hypothetical protein